MGNSLVAESETDWYAGIPLAEDAFNAAKGISGGDWSEFGVNLGVGALDALAFISDPIAGIGGMFAGYVMEHFGPAMEILNRLGGDPGTINQAASTWHNIANRVREDAHKWSDALSADSGMAWGEPADSYYAFANGHIAAMKGVAGGLDAVGDAIAGAGSIVAIVRQLIRDITAAVIGEVISAIAEEVCSLGLATGWVIAQISEKAAWCMDKIVTTMDKLVSSLGKLAGLIEKLMSKLGKLGEYLTKFVEKYGSTGMKEAGQTEYGLKILVSDGETLASFAGKFKHFSFHGIAPGDAAKTIARNGAAHLPGIIGQNETAENRLSHAGPSEEGE